MVSHLIGYLCSSPRKGKVSQLLHISVAIQLHVCLPISAKHNHLNRFYLGNIPHFFCDIFTPWRKPTERWVKCWGMWQFPHRSTMRLMSSIGSALDSVTDSRPPPPIRFSTSSTRFRGAPGPDHGIRLLYEMQLCKPDPVPKMLRHQRQIGDGDEGRLPGFVSCRYDLTSRGWRSWLRRVG
jgi:hypothetical protein